MKESERNYPVVEGSMHGILLILEDLVVKFPPVFESDAPFFVESVEGSIFKSD